jgi:hypothetical protein
MNSTETVAAGLRALPTKERTSFASTQAAWRFYQNKKITLNKLAEPLLEAAHAGVTHRCKQYALCAHDWSHLNYYKHTRKEDRYPITHETDVGYDLQSSLLIDDQMGQPIAPVAQRLVTGNGSYASYQREKNEAIKDHLDEVTDAMKWIDSQSFDKPLVHIIDREADSIGHIRQWEEKKMNWLTRSRITSGVEYQGESMQCSKVVEHLSFTKSKKVNYKGKLYWQWIAETPVRISRKRKPSQKKKKKPIVAGKPIEARLVVSRILSDSGEVLANWLLISNVMDVQAEDIAQWYYWRWNIESWFKLLKRAGHDLESWQQETGEAIAKRLLVVSMACVVVWEIAAAKGKSAKQFREFLIKLSGRQMKHNISHTNPALLAGLWVYLSMQEVLQTYSSDELELMRSMAKEFFP